MSEIFDNFFVEVSIQDVYLCPFILCITSFSIKDINVRSLHILCVYDVSYVSKIVSDLVWCFASFAWMDNVLDMKQAAVLKSSNIVGNVVANKSVDGHLHKFTHCSNENVHLYKQAYDEVCVIIYYIVFYLK
ncbi:hypothetical protein Hanom_Chr09g00802081 [Helianthus anomalus]